MYHIFQLFPSHDPGGNDSAFCASEKAVGCLQIRPIMLREVNRLLRKSGSDKRFSLADRWSREKSIEIFDTWRSISHPNDSDEVVARCWNGGPKGWKRKQRIAIGRRLLHIYMKMKKVKITINELYDAMRPNVNRNKKKYTRKAKHKNKDADS